MTEHDATVFIPSFEGLPGLVRGGVLRVRRRAEGFTVGYDAGQDAVDAEYGEFLIIAPLHRKNMLLYKELCALRSGYNYRQAHFPRVYRYAG